MATKCRYPVIRDCASRSECVLSVGHAGPHDGGFVAEDDKPSRVIGPFEIWGNGLKDSWMVRDTRINRVVLSGMTRAFCEQWAQQNK